MTIKTVKMSSGHQVYLPDEIIEEAEVEEGQSFLVRVHGNTIELIPAHIAEEAMDEGLANLRTASMDHLTEEWDNSEDEAWNDA